MKYLQKVLNVICIVAYSDIEGVSVIEVSEKAGLPMSSTHRILNDLVECEALVKNMGAGSTGSAPDCAAGSRDFQEMNLNG